ncbi:putative beta-glucosidase [Rosa chinensis]|uniref:Putative beta-glucosidase n=1 Tax=Rosa chinensis TaxID=74649 RepID=A0A2P6P514_ROSCH|nr:putative beta-glucosidase [Rosa chinensis]
MVYGTIGVRRISKKYERDGEGKAAYFFCRRENFFFLDGTEEKTLIKGSYDFVGINYHKSFYGRAKAARLRGRGVRQGYFVWTLFDSFEWGMGLTKRLGLYYIDFNDNFNRIPNLSVKWFQAFLKSNQTRSS